MKKNTRRAGIALSAMLLGTALLTGCGGGQAAASAGANAGSIAKPAAHSSFPLVLKDDTGRRVVIPHKPTRIVSLTLGTDEILTALVPLSEIVGVDYYATQPIWSHITGLVEQHHLRVLGSSTGEPSAEELVKLHPNLILAADYDSPKLIQQLTHLKIPVYEFTSFNSIGSIESHILTIGRMVGYGTRAQAIVHDMQQELAKLKKTAPKKKLTVLYYTSYQNTISIAGAQTTGNSIIKAAGGVNVAASLSGWATVSAEKVLAYNPDVIIIPNDSGKQKLQLKQFLRNPVFKSLRAVRNHHVYTASDGNLSAVSQYIVLGVQDVQKMLIAASKTK
ncbi:MAG: ABC transporter substrate-binding protein [Bacilli bacterium]